MDEVLVAEDVRRTYGDAVALDGVSLTCDAGEVLALVGPNGAGKTTFVRAVTGTTDAEGSVTLFGTDPTAVRRDRIGLLPQAFAPQERLTARELLAYYAGLYDETREVDGVLADVGLADAADTWYENLSGGQQRRTCVGAALINDPDLLVLDEPTTGIDPAGRRSLWRLLEDLADEGVSILLTTHDMAEAERLADRVGLVADGELVALDAPETLVDEYGGRSTLTVTGSFGPEVGEALDYPTERSASELRIFGVAPERIGAVVDDLSAAGATYEELSWSEPDLEDVYLELTGTRVTESGRARGHRTGSAPAGTAERAASAGGDGR